MAWLHLHQRLHHLRITLNCDVLAKIESFDMIARGVNRLDFTAAALLLLLLAPCSVFAADPASVPAPDLKPGDTWVYDRSVEEGTSEFSDKHIDLRVEHVGPETMVVGLKTDGSPVDFEDHVMGVDWSQRRLTNGEQTTTGRPLSFPLAVGKTWTSNYTDPIRYGLQMSAEHRETYKVVGWEDVTTPAGTFHAIKIESEDHVKGQFAAANGAIGGAFATADGSTVVAHTNHTEPRTIFGEFFSTFYYCPTIKYWVKTVQDNYNSENVRTQRQTDVLVSFKPAF